MKRNKFTSPIFAFYAHHGPKKRGLFSSGKFETSSARSHPLVNNACSVDATSVLRSAKCTSQLLIFTAQKLSYPHLLPVAVDLFPFLSDVIFLPIIQMSKFLDEVLH
jgi:hypothetical protein